LAVLLSDGDGLRQALSWRGAASLKPCIKHPNVCKKDWMPCECVRSTTCVVLCSSLGGAACRNVCEPRWSGLPQL
jgi:hypothetical protein